LRLYASALVAGALVAGLCSAGSAVASAAAAPGVGETTSGTALAVSVPSVVTGDEQDEQLTVTVSGDGGTPTGTVTVVAGDATVCTITLAEGTGGCAPTADEFPVGPVALTASYSGDDTFEASTSPTVGFEVTSPPPPAVAATTTTLKLSTASIVYGDEQAEKISVTVSGPGAAPVGTVTIKAGATKVCTLSLSSGTGSCALKAAALPPGTAKVTASYAGNADFGASVSAAKSLAIARERATTTVSLSPTKVTYGAEQRERISVAVRPAHGGVPAGRVTVKAGSAVICVITLRSAKGVCSPGPARLAAGRHAIAAVYGGSGDVASSASAAKSLSVAVASSKTSLSLSKGTVTYGGERSEKISVKVAPRYAGMPGGTVTVRANGATLAVIRLKSGVGSYPLSAKRLAAGRYSLTATYGGSANFARSVSAKKSLTVASPPPPPAPPAACHPRSSAGNCYEPGEYCSDADHGLTGVAGDGETIKCEDNNGWRWEPVS
jgi:Bacterial Ig-like domain (group 3)